MMGVAVTDDANAIVYPKGLPQHNGFYRLVGYNAKRSILAFVDFTTPMYAQSGQEMRIWYLQDLMNFSEDNNSGVACANVYAKFM